MTTLNQAFIRVYAKQQSGSQLATGSNLSGPGGVHLRVDAGSPVPGNESLAGSVSAMGPIHAGTSTGVVAAQVESGTQFVASAKVAPVAANSDCVIAVEPPVAAANQHYAASCVKRPPLNEEIRWPSVCRALALAAPDSLQAAGKTLLQAVAEGMKYIAVTSAETGVGVTTAAICLARAAALQGVRVALVDAHFAAPQLAVEMGLKASCSWYALANDQQPGIPSSPFGKDGVTFYPLQLRAADDLTDWTRSTLGPSLHHIAECQDLVVLDVGPVLVAWGYGFSRIVDELIDGVVLVRDRRQQDEFAACAAMDRLRRRGLEVVIAENFVS